MMLDDLEREKDTGGWAFLIWAIPLLLSFCGVMMILSLSLRDEPGTPYIAPMRQLTFLAIGILAMFLMASVSIQALRQASFSLWIIAFVFLLLILVPQIGKSGGGARRWINIGFGQFQPSEFLMFVLPIFLADRLNSINALQRSDLRAFFQPTLLLMGLSCLPMGFQHLGGIMVVASVCLMMHIENRGWKYPLRGIVILIGVFSVLVMIAPYRVRRFQSYLDPWSVSQGDGFQIIQGLIAFANGGLNGLGIGKGLQEKKFLPAAKTDYILAAFGEEFGLVGTLSLLALYAWWTYRVYKMYKNLNDPFLSCLAIGMTSSIICPMFINLAGVTKLLPLTGIPMPFLSMGGSAMVFMWAKVGVLIAISQYGLRPAIFVLPPLSQPLAPAEPEPRHSGHLKRRRNRSTSEIITTLRDPDLNPKHSSRMHERDNRPDFKPGSRTGRGRRNG